MASSPQTPGPSWPAPARAAGIALAVAIAAFLLAAGCEGVPSPGGEQADATLGRPAHPPAAPAAAWSADVAEAVPLATMGSRSPSVKPWKRVESGAYGVVDDLQEHEAELAWKIEYAHHLRAEGHVVPSRRIALTFDDGPHPGWTPRLLSVLKSLNIKATFFLVGKQAAKFPDLVRDIAAGGHDIGNHTYNHRKLTYISKAAQQHEISNCGEMIRDITGKAPHLFRPPGGHYNIQVGRMATALGYRVILWTDNSGDYSSPGVKVIERRVIGRARNGGIVLCHDGIEQTLEALPVIVNTLRKRGYHFVTVDEMFSPH